MGTPITDPEELAQLIAPPPGGGGAIEDPYELAQLERTGADADLAQQFGRLPDLARDVPTNFAGQIDFSRPVREVRAQISRLPPEDRQEALRQWAEARVEQERSSGGRRIGPGDFERNLARGLIGGSFIDEGIANIEGGLHSISGGHIGSPYLEALEYERAQNRAVDRDRPIASTVQQIAGGLVTGGSILPAARTWLGRIGLGSAVGTGHAFVQGAGSAEPDQSTSFGNALMERGQAGLDLAPWGTAIGALTPPAIGVVSAAGRAVHNFASPTLARWAASIGDRLPIRVSADGAGPDAASAGAQAAARQILANTTVAAGRSADDLRRPFEALDNARTQWTSGLGQSVQGIVDVLPSTQRLGSSVARKSTEAGNRAIEFIDPRQTGFTPPTGAQAAADLGLPTRPRMGQPLLGREALRNVGRRFDTPENRTVPTGQGDRLLDMQRRAFLIEDDVYHGHGPNARQTEQAMARRLKAEEDRLYPVAWREADDFDLSQAINNLNLTRAEVNDPGVHGVINRAIRLFTREGPPPAPVGGTIEEGMARIRQGLATGGSDAAGPLSRASELQRFDLAKRRLDGLIDRYRGRDSFVYGTLVNFRRELLDAVHGGDRLQPARNLAYSEARGQSFSQREMLEDIAAGKAAVHDAQAGIDYFRGLESHARRQFFRLGVNGETEALVNRMKHGADKTQIFDNPNMDALHAAIIPRTTTPTGRVKIVGGEPAEFSDKPERFGRYIEAEKRQISTRNEVLGNSKSVQRYEDDKGFEIHNSLANLFQQLRSGETGVVGLSIRAVERLLGSAFGMRQSTAAALGEILFTADRPTIMRVLADVEQRMGRNRMEQFARYMQEAQSRLTGIGTRQATTSGSQASEVPPSAATGPRQFDPPMRLGGPTEAETASGNALLDLPPLPQQRDGMAFVGRIDPRNELNVYTTSEGQTVQIDPAVHTVDRSTGAVYERSEEAPEAPAESIPRLGPERPERQGTATSSGKPGEVERFEQSLTGRATAPFRGIAGSVARLIEETPPAFNRLLQYRPGTGDEQAPVDAFNLAGLAATGTLVGALPHVLGGTTAASRSTLGTFVGREWAEEAARRGRPTGLQVLDMAERLEQRGLSEGVIRDLANTVIAANDPALGGIAKGAEGRWRLEIDDSGSSFTGGREGPASEVLHHPELYFGLPQAGNVHTTVALSRPGSDMAGLHVPGRAGEPGRVAVEAPTRGGAHTGLLHEIGGHEVQTIEGFPSGTDLSWGPRMYRNSAGEVEARNVETRQDYTPAERRQVAPRLTEDVPRAEQIVSRRTGESSQMAGRRDPNEPWAFEQAQEPGWSDLVNRGEHIDRAAWQEDVGPARPPSATQRKSLGRQDQLGRQTEQLMREVAQTEAGLKQRGMSPEEIASQLDRRFRDRVGPGRFDAADIANSTGWWRDQQIAATGRTHWRGIPYSAEEVALTQRLYKEGATMQQIADAVRALSGRPLKDGNSVSQLLRSANVKRARKPSPDLVELWPREANLTLYELNRRGEKPEVIGEILTSQFGHQYSSQLVREQIGRLRLNIDPEISAKQSMRAKGTMGQWQPEAAELLQTPHVEVMTGEAAAEFLTRETGQIISRSAVLSARHRMGIDRMRNHLMEDLSASGQSFVSANPNRSVEARRLLALATGLTVKQVAERLGISTTHVRNARRQLTRAR